MVQQRLMDLIFAGDIVSGDKVTEISVAERLGVSRGPVREAFRALEEGGLLVTERNRGVFVRRIAPEEAVEIQEVRSALDEMAARRAATVLNARQIKDLQGLIADMDAAADHDDVQLFFALNLKFHEQLVRWSGNAKLLTTYQRLIMELHLYRQKGLEPTGEMHHSNVAHKEILHQIALGNPDGAAKAMRDHTAHGRQRILLGQNEASNLTIFAASSTPKK
jgi:DNA-binding GntR family transcriptional regulator